MLINATLRWQSQKVHEFKTNLMYIVRPFLKGGGRGEGNRERGEDMAKDL